MRADPSHSVLVRGQAGEHAENQRDYVGGTGFGGHTWHTPGSP